MLLIFLSAFSTASATLETWIKVDFLGVAPISVCHFFDPSFLPSDHLSQAITPKSYII